MELHFRLAEPADHDDLERMAIESFEPITFFKKVDDRFGPLNGVNWRERWQNKLRKAFRNETVLVGTTEGQLVAMAVGTIQEEMRLAFLDILAVGQEYQGHGCGRQMLRAFKAHAKQQGAGHIYLDCLVSNENANCLYQTEGFEEMTRSIYWYAKL